MRDNLHYKFEIWPSFYTSVFLKCHREFFVINSKNFNLIY